MANEFNNLGSVLQAIGRQIALGKHTAARGSRPERDLPILLLPTAAHGLTGSDRERTEGQLPYLLGSEAPAEPAPEIDSAVTAPRVPAIRLPRHEGAFLRLDVDPLGGRA